MECTAGERDVARSEPNGIAPDGGAARARRPSPVE
jgi:hypothetical protein